MSGEELRDRVVRIETKLEGIENVPGRVIELEAGFTHMKSTLEDIRLQGMEQSRREDQHYSEMTSLIQTSHSKVMERMGGVEKRQNTIYTSFNVVVFCAALLIGGIYLWSNVFSPSLSDRIHRDARVTTSKTTASGQSVPAQPSRPSASTTSP